MTAKLKIKNKESLAGFDVFIGNNLLSKLGKLIKDNIGEEASSKRFMIIIGRKSASLYLDTIKKSLKSNDINNITSVIINNEKIKCVSNVIPIIVGGNRFRHLLNKIGRAIYVPTTLLSMSNNAVSGEPLMVVSDINLLHSLEYKYLMSGYSEIIKHAILNDFELFEWLEAHGRSLFDGDENARFHAIKRSCEIKAKMISHEDSERLLNLGHLFADAIFELSNEKFLHGEAISIGIVASFKLAQYLELCSVDDYKRVRRHLKSMSLPVSLYADYWDAEELINSLNMENIILPQGIGKMINYKDEISKDMLLRVAYEMISE